MPDHPPAEPLSWRNIARELSEIKRQLDTMEAEDAAHPPEPPLLFDPILFPTVADRIAEIERRHTMPVRTNRWRKLLDAEARA